MPSWLTALVVLGVIIAIGATVKWYFKPLAVIAGLIVLYVAGPQALADPTFQAILAGLFVLGLVIVIARWQSKRKKARKERENPGGVQVHNHYHP